jgi:hypothetical protein
MVLSRYLLKFEGDIEHNAVGLDEVIIDINPLGAVPQLQVTIQLYPEEEAHRFTRI